MEALKILAAFAAGIGCGVFATRAYFKKQYKEIADEEIESVVETFKIKVEDSPKSDKKVISKEKKEEDKTMTKYHKINDDYISSVPSSVLAGLEHPEDDSPIEQYQITSMEFFNDGDYDKASMIYYVEDETLVCGEEIEDIGQTVGQECIDILGTGFDDGSAMYIRNPRTKVDYELTKSYASYKEMMLNE